MYVVQLPVSCPGFLYGLEHHQDCSGHQSLSDPGPSSDGCGGDCGNIPVCWLHARKMFCLALPIESRNVKSL